MSNYEIVIGLEVHAQLATESKIFTPSGTTAGLAPNSLTDPTTLGLPGSLPVLNKRVVDYAIKLGLALECNISPLNVFARKHYHYPDLPKGYQISQYEKPICEGGHLMITVGGEKKRINLTRIHMEEDAGKSVHLDTEASSVVDLNRAGVPLLEIVSEPELRTSEEAGAYMREMRQVVRYLDICDGNMDEGSLRCDANVSLRPAGQTEFGTKVEIKNLNSFRFVEKALDYEIARQGAQLDAGNEIVQETRLWDEHAEKTKPMRSKEFAEDYRYFPDPDLLPVVISAAWVSRIKDSLPELPQDVRARFQTTYHLDEETAGVLSAEKSVSRYYDQAVTAHNNPQAIANWISTELFGRLYKEEKTIEDCPVSPENLASLVQLIDEEVISGKIAKSVFDEMFEGGLAPSNIVEAKGLKQISDPKQLTSIIERVLADNQDQVAAYRSGKTKIFGFFVGQLMKETDGKANPGLLNKLLKQKLDS